MIPDSDDLLTATANWDPGDVEATNSAADIDSAWAAFENTELSICPTVDLGRSSYHVLRK